MAETVQGIYLSPTCVQEPMFTGFQEFIEALDGIDNGITQYTNDIKPKYRNHTDLSSRVGWLNPAWNEPFDSQTLDVGSPVLGFYTFLVYPCF
jgi:uncharacterized UPF0160 family protein